MLECGVRCKRSVGEGVGCVGKCVGMWGRCERSVGGGVGCVGKYVECRGGVKEVLGEMWGV